jgi:hypothetical protein
VSTKILKARNTGNNKKLEKVKENEMNRQVVYKENTHTNIYILWIQKLAKITRRGISYKHTKYIKYAKCTVTAVQNFKYHTTIILKHKKFTNGVNGMCIYISL